MSYEKFVELVEMKNDPDKLKKAIKDLNPADKEGVRFYLNLSHKSSNKEVFETIMAIGNFIENNSSS